MKKYLLRLKSLFETKKVEGVLDLRPNLKDDERKVIFANHLFKLVSQGWRVEAQKDLEGVVSRKVKFPLFGWIVAVIISFFIFAPISLIILVVMVVRAVNPKVARCKVSVDRKGTAFIWPL